MDNRWKITPSQEILLKPITVKVLLHCTKTNVSENGEIKLDSFPQDILEVKGHVEKQCNIPTCVQVMSFDGQILNNDTKLLALRFRDGDVFRIEYLSRGDCKDLVNIVSWLDRLIGAMTTGSADLANVIQLGIRQDLLESLPTYFSPWDHPKTYVNKLYFLDNDGVKKLVKIYEFILLRPWSELDQDFKYLECWVIKSLWDFAETFPIRRFLVQYNVIQMLTQSLLRVRLEEGRRIQDYDTTGRQFGPSLLVETIFGSIGVLLNLTELPECQLEIAKNKDILHQVSCVSVAPSLNAICAQLIASFFGNLAFTPQTHPFIADSVYIQRLLRACGKFSVESENGSLLKYFTFLSLIQVCLLSPHCIVSDWYEIITNMMESFLQANSYQEIRNAEINRGFNCSIFIPYVKLAYFPNVPRVDGLVGKLQHVSLQVAIFALQNLLGRECHRELLLKEGLLDYVVCMPQYVPPSLRPQAEELVQMVVSSPDIPEGPPRLLNLVKARLAKMHFGLEQVLSLSVSEMCQRHF